MKTKIDLSKCLPYDTLLIILLVLVSIIYLINFMNEKHVDDKYESVAEKYVSFNKKYEGNPMDSIEHFKNEKFENHEDAGTGEVGMTEEERVIQMITTAYASYQESQKKYDESSDKYSKATLEFNEAIESKADSKTQGELSDKRNNASSAIYVNLRSLNDTKERLESLKKQYPEEYAKVVTGSDALEEEDKDTKHVLPNIVHNHYNQYYGGNPEMTKFLQQLTSELKENKQEGDMNLMDQGMCSELNNKLSTMTLAEFKNNRFVQDLKSRCEKSDGVDCSFRPTNSQTALLGTLLEDAKKTRVGDILPKDEISTDY